jgi:hypothetical protein
MLIDFDYQKCLRDNLFNAARFSVIGKNMEENKVRKLSSEKHVAVLRFELNELKELCRRRAVQESGKLVAKADPDNVEWEM